MSEEQKKETNEQELTGEELAQDALDEVAGAGPGGWGYSVDERVIKPPKPPEVK